MDINTLPHSEEAEKNIVGIFISDNNKIGDAIAGGLIKTEDFYSLKIKKICEKIFEMYNQNKPIDIVTLSAKLQGDSVFEGKEVLYIKSICGAVVTTHNLKFYCDIVRQYAMRRKYIVNAEKIKVMAYDSSKDINSIEHQISKMTDDDSSTVNANKINSVSELMIPVFDRLVETRAQKGKIPGHKTGFPSIDAYTGGMLNGNMFVIAARPGMGKSILGNNIAEFTALHEDKPAIIFNMEMSAEEIIYRLISSTTNTKYSDIQFGCQNDDVFNSVGEFGNKIMHKKLYIQDQAYITMSQIRATSRNVKRKHGEIGVIVVDYLQLISPETTNSRYNRNDVISEISRGLKNLAKELQCPIIVLSQLSRENEKRQEKRPVLSDLRDSGAIEQDADIVAFIHRDDYYNQDNKNGIAEIIIAKNRHGQTGTVKLSWQAQIMKFMEMSEYEKLKKDRLKNGQAK